MKSSKIISRENDDVCEECGEIDCTSECNCRYCQSWRNEPLEVKGFFLLLSDLRKDDGKC